MGADSQTIEATMRVQALTDHVDMLERAIDQRFKDMVKHYDSVLHDHAKLDIVVAEAGQMATAKAEKNMEARFESVNNFRATLSDQISRFVTRDLHDSLERDIRARMEQITTRQNLKDGEKVGAVETKQSNMASLALIVTAVGALSGFFGSVLAALLRGHI